MINEISIYKYTYEYLMRCYFASPQSRLSENETIMPASKARRLKEEHFGGFYLGVFETSRQTERFRTGWSPPRKLLLIENASRE